MTNKPEIPYNKLDKTSKTGEQYEKELNNPDVHNQIIETFDNNEKKESKENVKKSLEFEDHPFSIDSADSTLWEETSAELNRATIKVKIKKTGDVIEYLNLPELEDSPIYYNRRAGKQVFPYYNGLIKYVGEDKNCSLEDVERKYLMTKDEFIQKMSVMTKEEFLKLFNTLFENNVPIIDGITKTIDNNPFRIHIWLAGGKVGVIEMDNKFSVYDDIDPSRPTGFSAILLKN